VQEKPVATGPIYLGIYFLSSTKMEQKCDRFSLGHTYLFITLALWYLELKRTYNPSGKIGSIF
ncbi:MAG: hypothetical protein U9Q68_10880, partial [Euryarchaeota archaeon]|nr:hypothetical protein [Euryarchaeota archaeon]